MKIVKLVWTDVEDYKEIYFVVNSIEEVIPQFIKKYPLLNPNFINFIEVLSGDVVVISEKTDIPISLNA